MTKIRAHVETLVYEVGTMERNLRSSIRSLRTRLSRLLRSLERSTDFAPADVAAQGKFAESAADLDTQIAVILRLRMVLAAEAQEVTRPNGCKERWQVSDRALFLGGGHWWEEATVVNVLGMDMVEIRFDDGKTAEVNACDLRIPD